MPFARRISCALVLGALTLTACPQQRASEHPDPDASPAQAEAPSCGVDSRFVEREWIPRDARLVTFVERRHPERAAALAQLAALADDPSAQLPVFAALDYRNLAIQLSIFDGVLDQLELAPAEFVELQGPEGELVWLWPTDCAREEVGARVLARLGVMLRANMDHPSQRHGAAVPERFPFDLIAIGEGRLALTRAGEGRRVGAWLDADADPNLESPAAWLDELEPAPIRSLLLGSALLAPEDESAPPSTRARVRRFRVLAESWEDLSLPVQGESADPATSPAPDTPDPNDPQKPAGDSP